LQLITVKGLTKTFGEIRALDQLTFSVAASELTVVIGPSGCGKSTLLRCLNGLESFEAGEVRIGDFEVTTTPAGRVRLREEVGMVFQAFHLFPHLTTLENVALGPRVVKRVARQQAEEQARELLARVGLADRLDFRPGQLSGGQQQRAAIARALAMSPRVVLYDEPTSALDPGRVGEVLRIMRQLDDEGMTQIVVTHEMKFAREVADKVMVLIDGRMVETGTPEQIFTAPRDPRTREFLRRYL
jgi:ABC-type polar amino acid transport system ATPase subunit